MVATRQAGTLNRVANRLNYDMVGSRSLLYGTADRLLAGAPGHSVAALAQIDARWGQRDIWSTMSHADGRLTSHFLLAALDLRLDVERSEEHPSELQSLMRISYAVFCLKKTRQTTQPTTSHHTLINTA